jgi:protein-L-isoaspartate(D-aspartate) O-methyltransferase
MVRTLIAVALVCACNSSKPVEQHETKRYVDPDPYGSARADMVDVITQRGPLDARVRAVMQFVPRHEFVPADQQPYAYDDRPLPIGYNSTISQPYIVAIMTAQANVHPGDRVLEIGTGSGYQAAILAELGAKVYSIEINPELGEHTKQTLTRLGLTDIHLKIGDGYDGWPDAAPFDAIVVTTAPRDVPPPLVEQLKIGGRMVIPVGDDFQELKIYTREPDGLTDRDLLDVRFSAMQGKAADLTK